VLLIDVSGSMAPYADTLMRFAHVVVRKMPAAGSGAEVFTIGASWPAVRQHHWRSLLIARAIENQAFIVAVNRTGSDPHLKYAGGSLIVAPTGEILAEADDRAVDSSQGLRERKNANGRLRSALSRGHIHATTSGSRAIHGTTEMTAGSLNA